MLNIWITSPADGATVPPSFSVTGGVTPANATVTVTLDCGSGPVAFPVNVDPTGNWSATVSTTAGSGTRCTLCAEATYNGQSKKVCIEVIIGAQKKSDAV